MHRPIAASLCLLLACQLAAQAPDEARIDRDAALRHYAAVEAELRLAPLPADPAVAARRLQAIEHLREYRERGDLGRNHAYAGSRVPLFVDDDGRRCAVAWLLDRSGHGDLTEAIHRRANRAWVAELTRDGELANWLATTGLTAAEAARIQAPSSHSQQQLPPEPREPQEVPDWRPGEERNNPSPTSPPPKQPSANPGGATVPTSSVASARGTGTTSSARGTAIDALQSAAWLDWWEWNRGTFEPPQPLPQSAPAMTTEAPAIGRRQVEMLLRGLAADADAGLRSAAVQALGRIGADADFACYLTDAAREVRLMALLGLGRSGQASHAWMLARATDRMRQGETLTVALAGVAMLGDSAVQRTMAATVRERLTDARPNVQSAAALAVATQAEAPRRDAARAAMAAATTPWQRAAAAELLGPGADVDDVATLTALANDRSLDVRRSASLALGRSRHPLALAALQTAFELEHEGLTQAMQLLAMGDHGGDAARPFLLTAMTAGRKALRAHAALALGLWGRGRASGDTQSIGDAVAAAFDDENNQDQKGAYLLALGMLRHAAARDLMLRELRTSTVSSCRGCAAAGLGLLGDRAALPALAKTLTEDSCPWARQQAARALPGLGSAAIAPLAQAMRDDKDAAVKSAAAFALGGIAHRDAAEALVALASNTTASPAVRAGAALGLGRQFRRHEPQLPRLRFQHNHLLLPDITAWAFAQEL